MREMLEILLQHLKPLSRAEALKHLIETAHVAHYSEEFVVLCKFELFKEKV